MDYNFKVYRRDREFMKTDERAMRFASIARVPFIVDSRPGYHRIGNQYLIDRALGKWDVVSRGTRPSRYLTDQTLENIAQWSANFLEFCELRGIPLERCDYYQHLMGKYQEEMLNGRWSRDRAPLAATTVNLRVDNACALLMWMSDHGLRPPLDVPYHTINIGHGRATDPHGYRTREVNVREGKVKKNKKRLRIPTNKEVGEWLIDVEARSGPVLRLMCEVILRTAVRKSEAAGWRIDTVPDEPDPDRPTKWHIPNRDEGPESDQTVTIEIKYGAKGRQQQAELDHGDKVGPAGDIWIPLDLARKLQDYKTRVRPKALLNRIRSGKTPKERSALKDHPPVHLFLDEATGNRITGKQLYDAWTGAKVPYKGWSPHLGRDFWACTVLMREIKKDAAIAKAVRDGTLAELPPDYIRAKALSAIPFVIQRQLRHASKDTSEIYCEWAIATLSRGLNIGYGDDDEDTTKES